MRTDNERLIAKCNRDIVRAVEEGRFAIETPRGSVEQTTIQNLNVYVTQPTKQMWYRGNPEPRRGPTLFGLKFALPMEGEAEHVSTDLMDMGGEVVIYGDQHLWRLSEPWSGEAHHDGFAVGEKVTYQHKYEWGTVEEIDWRA